jgi:hypothetical protein
MFWTIFLQAFGVIAVYLLVSLVAQVFFVTDTDPDKRSQ